MKKISLKNLNLGVNDLLQRNQLKTVFGGDGGYGGCRSCNNNSDCPGNGVCASNRPGCPSGKYCM